MKIVVLKGSPRHNGNSNSLADEFIRGAKENGHDIFEFNCTRHKVGGCLGCDKCGMRNLCVQRDDFDLLRPELIEADVIVFATPIYYFGVSGQLKNVIDRFYSAHDVMGHKTTYFFATMGNPNVHVADPSADMYDKMIRYLGWTDGGKILANGIWAKGAIQGTKFMDIAYKYGKELKNL